MNIRRGFFRMWLLSASLWVIFLLSILPVVMVADWYEHSTPLLTNLPDAPTCARVLAAALGPPAVLYGLGRALWWVLSGFRAAQSRT